MTSISNEEIVTNQTEYLKLYRAINIDLKFYTEYDIK